MRENLGCVEDGLVEYLVGCSRVSCSSQAWSARCIEGGNGTGCNKFITIMFQLELLQGQHRTNCSVISRRIVLIYFINRISTKRHSSLHYRLFILSPTLSIRDLDCLMQYRHYVYSAYVYKLCFL